MSEYDLTAELNALARPRPFMVISTSSFGFDWVRELFMAAVVEQSPPLGWVKDWQAPAVNDYWCRDCRHRTALDTRGLCENCGSQGVLYVG